jgi:hypothetical protein
MDRRQDVRPQEDGHGYSAADWSGARDLNPGPHGPEPL